MSFFQTTEAVDHYTWDHVWEDNLHEDYVDCIESETAWVDLVHVITDCTTCVDLQNTTNYVGAWFSWYVVFVDDWGISVEGDNVEDKDKATCESWKECEFTDIVDDSLEYVSE